MATRRKTPARKRPAPASDGKRMAAPAVQRSSGSDDGAQPSASVEDLVEEMRGELLGQLEEIMRGDASLDQADRDQLLEHFSNAFGAGDGSTAAGGDVESALNDSARQLKEIGASQDDGSGDLVRELNRALEPLERRETKVALEFGRRLQADGQSSALAWLKEQQQADEVETASAKHAVPDGSHAVGVSRDTVTKSKSRRLRGPPKPV